MPDERPQGLTPVGPRGGAPFVWVEDDSTGHRYDVPRFAVMAGMTPVEGYPLNWSGHARPTKYRLGGKPAESVQADEPSGDATQTQARITKSKEAGK